MPHDVRRQAAVASVCAGGVDIRYVRAGAGPVVILLDEAPLHEVAGGAAFGALVAGENRVVAPEVPETRGRDAGRWLRDFLEGLGVDRPAVVAAPALRAMLNEVAAGAPDLLGDVRFLAEPRGGADAHEGPRVPAARDD